MATEINVPIRLKVLQDSISEFQKILNNLQPNTNNWKALNKIISSMSTEAQKLQAQLSTPFSSEKQFTQTNKTIDKLEEAAARVSVVMQGLQFSDIKLTPEQTSQFNKFEEEINKIREAYKKLQDETKDKLFATEKNQLLLENIGKGTLEKDFEGLESAVENHIKKLDSQIKSRNEKLAELRSDKVLGDSATSLITKGMSAESIGEDVFNKYLRYTKDGMLTMNFGDKGVSKQALLNAIGEMYHLEPGELQKTIEESLGKSLKSINAEEINNVFKDMNKSGIFSGIIKRGKESAGKIPLQNQGTEEIRAQLEEYRTLAKEMQTLSSQANLPGASADTSTKITEINTRMRELEATILNGARTNSTYTSSMQQLTSQFPQLRSILESTNTQFVKMQQIQNTFNSMKNTIANFMGFYQVLNLTKRAVKEAANHIKELDSVMNKISIVTDMDTSDLWGQIDQYSKMAQTYGTTIKGAYEVSQIYYQQGLETADVLTLTNETLKLAKISGLDYASTTDYMTTAIRGFKMEMQDAETVVDVYSALAANTAVSQEELAVAMSKTASSMESVGSTFQETSAMIATMVAVTRESATNIGSAMKSIASRYGELTKDPSKLVDSEGEAMAFNKVDAALQSVGISMKTAEGQFREFTDVIVELGEKWAELDSVQQRYIATQFAGNRQQSRFLALVSNIDLLKQNIDVAENSEDVGNVQALKALDSLESKIEQVRVAYQQFYTTIGIEDVWKTFLDGAKSVVNTLNGMPKLFGKIPIAAINAIAQIVTLIKNVAFSALAKIANQIGNVLVQGTNNSLPQAQKAGESWVESVIQGAKGAMGKATSTGQLLGEYLNKGLLGSRTTSQFNTTQLLGWNERLGNGTNDITRSQIGLEMKDAGYLSTAGFTAFNSSAESATTMLATFMQQAQLTSARIQTLSNSLMGLGSALSLVSLSINTSTQGGKRASGVFMALSGVITGVAAAAKAVDGGLKAIPWYAVASAVISVISGITQFIEANSPAAALEEATTKAEELQNKAKELKADYNTLNNSIKKYNELEKSRYDSAEAAKEYQEQVDKLADAYPGLVQRYDENNQAVLNVNAMEEMLAKARDESAAATLRAAQAEAEKAKAAKVNVQNKLHTENDDLQNNYTHNPLNLPDWAQAHPDSVNQSDIIGGIVSEENRINLQKLIQGMVDESEAGNAEGIIQYYEQLVNLAKELDISFSDGLRKAIEKTRNAAYEVIDQDTIIDVANRATVSAFMNDYYGSENSNISAFKDNSGLMTAATDTLYNSVWNEHYDTITLMETADNIFSGIDALYSGISENRRAEIDSILNNPSHYSGEDIKILLPELANTEWLITYFDNQIKYNKEQLTNKIEQLRTNRQNYANGKIDESLTLLPKQIQQFEDAITENTTLDMRNLMTSGINQAQNLKKTGQNPQEFIDYFTEFYQQVSTLPADLRNSLIEQFSANGFTKEGLTKTLDWINNNEDIKKQNVNFSSLENMTKSFVPNISLTVASLEDSLTNNLDDIESIFSDLQNGIKGSKLGKTIAKAQELGLDLERSDFKEDGDKFVLRYEKFADLISHIDDIYTMALPEEGEFEKAYKNLTRIVFGDKLVDLHRVQDIQAILGSTYYDYFDANDQLKAGITSEQVYDALEKAYASTDADLEQYQAWLKIIEQHLTKTIDWKHGDYSTLEGKVDLTQTDESGAAIDTAYKRVQYLAAHPDAYTESELKEADVSNAVETYQKGLGDLLTDLSKYGANYLINRGDKYEGVAAETVSNIQKLANEKGTVAAIRTYGEQAEMSISEINNAIIEAVAPGRAKSLTNMIGKSTTLSDLAKYAETYKIGEGKVEQFLTEDGKLGGELGKLYDLDALTGELKLKSTSTTFDQVLAAYKADLKLEEDITGDLRNQLYQAWIASIISEEDKNDAGKQMASAISSLSSAKLGTRVDLSKSPELAEKLGTIYEVTSEAARDAMLLALDASEFDDAEVRAAIISTQSTIRSKQASRTNINTLLSSNISQDTARNYIAAITDVDASLVDDKTLEGYMKNRGYVWSAIKQEFIATEDALSWYDEQIAAATGTPEEIAALREKRNQIEQELHKNHANEAILNVLSNAEDAADALTTFQAWFPDIDINDFSTVDNEGKRKVNIEKLKDAVGEKYKKLFDNYINQIADEYINNAQTAGSLMTQGTTSKTEMDAFQKAYEKVMGEGSVAQFMYDAVTHTMVLDPTQLRSYLTSIAAKKEFGLTPEQQKDWVDSQIEALTTDNLDFSKVLDGSATEEDTKSLKRNLEQYIKTNLPDEYKLWSEADQKEFIEGYADHIIADIEQGGQVAIDAIKSTGKELSTEEIEAAYRAQVAPLVAISEKLSELQVGSVVAANQIAALNDAGFTVNENGVVTAVGNMVEAYKSIYYQMKATSEATTTELNDAYAQLLTAEDQRNIDITEALKNGNGMSYTDFGELLSKYDISFEEYMTEHYDAVMRDGFGNIRITDWNAFAESIWGDSLDQVKNTQEYTSAFKAYNDGLIELNKNAEDAIVDEIKQIEGAKAGDWLNFSELWTKLESAWETIDFKTAVPNYNGNVSNMGHRVIVPGKIMDQYFGGHNGWGTIFGEDVAFKEFGDTYANIGATFANLTEEGKKAPDIAAYAKELYTMAISRVGGDASKVTADLIKQIDAEEENLILNIKDFGDSVKPEEVLNALWEESDLYHKAEEQAYSATEVINASLQMYGASLEDGILKIGENANLLGVAQVLQEASEMAGLEIGNGLEEVKDTVLNILKSYSEAIMKGIDGGLSNTEAADLRQKASDMGIKDLQFTQTKEGLKLSNESAKELYNTLKQIDALQGELVFSKLMDSLIATEDHFKTIQDTQAYINKLRSEIEAPNNADRLKSLQDELDLAEKINMTRSIETEDDSFKFMEGKIPDAQNNPLNYWKNWAKAFEAMKEAGKGSGAAKNTMGYEDFYNIVSEMGRLADITGKGVQLGEHTLNNSKQAADLITQAAGALKNVNGELVVDLSGIKVDFTSGLTDLGEQIDGQVDALADSQIHMLDAIIAVLEIIVAMEKLKDLDIDSDLTLDFSELGIEVNDDGSIKSVNENLQSTVDDLLSLEATLEDGTSVLDAVSIQSDKFNITMRDFLEHYRDVDWLNEKGITGNMYKTLFSNMLKLVASPDWLDAAKNGSNFFEMMNRYDWGDLVIGVNTPDVTLRMGGTGNLSVDWSNVDSDAYERAFEEEFNEQVKTDLQKALDTQSSTDTGLTADTNTKLKILNHTVVEVTDKEGNKTGEYTIAGHPGKKYSNKTLAAAVAELYEQGATEIDDTQWDRTETVKGKIKIGSAEFELESDGGDAQYTFKGQTGKNATEVFNKFISEKEQKDTSGLFDKDGAINQESARYKELQVQYGLSLTPIITYTTSDGKTKEGDINKDTVLRDAVKDYLDTGTTKDIEVGDKATTVTLKGGIKATIPNDQLEFEIDKDKNKKVTEDSLKSYFSDLTGIDLGLKDTISSAIKDALSDIDEQLGSLAEKISSIIELLSKDEFKTNIGKIGESWGQTLVDKFSNELTEMPSKVSDALELIKGLAPALEEIGKQLGQALITGFENALSLFGVELPENQGNETESPGGNKPAVKTPEGKEPPQEQEQKTPEIQNPNLRNAAPVDTENIKAYEEALNNLPKDATTNVKADGADEAIKSVQELTEEYEKLQSNSSLELEVKEDLDEVNAQLESTNEQVDAVRGKIPIELEIDVESAKTKVDELQAKIDSLKQKEPLPELMVTNGVSGVVDAAQAAIDGLTGKTVHIYVYTHYITTGRGCFVAGTKIYMADGTVKNIEDVYLNDVVIAYNPDTNEFVPKKVIDGYTHHNTARIVEITFSDGTTLKMTPSHPILTTKGWRSLDPITSLDEHGILPTWLEIGDKVNGYYGEVEIVNIKELPVPQDYDTYDFEVEDCHTFLAEGIPVHNAIITGPAYPKGAATSKAKGSATWLNPMGQTFAKGNVTGEALAGGRKRTLMGELGPEMYVTGGRYYMAGQNGAEFVNLPDDAIVFNHMQTKSLMSKGQTGHGKPVTSERNAISWAKGNAEGPAQASASAALNALKQLRAMWESLKSASISDLAGGAGGGGGGGGGGDNAKIVDPSIWVDTVERWYNLMQKIAKLEKEITHEEKLRSKLSSDWTANGNHYYASQKRSLEALRDQIDAQEQLNLSREAYYDQRVEALQNQPFGKLIEFDNEGQMRFKEGAMDWLTNLVGFDQNGKANYTDEEKYNILMAAGYGDYMKYDSSGGEIKMDEDNNGEVTDEERQSFYGNATKAFWDKIDEYKEATQSLWDSIKEGEDSILQLQADQNELLADIRENQMAVEDAVLNAIEDMRQREIDALQDERDKLEESTQKYIDGLSDALNREQEMYQNQEDENSLNQQKRRLAILQRSGGSAEDIANLRAEIDSSERERYFNLQQQQIDAIQRASDLEIERMDSQIELMTETLEYQKEYGLLWGNVYEVMEGTAAQITSFIIHGNSEFWALSPLGTADQTNQTLFKAEQWSSYRKDLNDVKEKTGENEVTAKDIRDNVALMVTMTRRQLADTDYTIFDEAMKAEFGEDYDPNSAYKQLFYDDYMGHGDVTRATATARAKYAADKKAAEDAAAAAQAAAEAAAAAEEPHGGEPEENKGCPDCAVNCGGACYNACQNGCAQVCQGKTRQNDPNVGNCNDHCTMTARGHTGTNRTEGNAYHVERATGKAAGGYVGHGIYELGERGTETVLTASQTRVLRQNILSNRPNSLISLLKSYNEGYDGINSSLDGVTPVEDNSVNIEHVEMTMEVKQIANDYDARKAGEQALNEMMRIARKTGAANSIRR